MENSPQISVSDFIYDSPAELKIKVLAGENGLSKRFLTSERVQKFSFSPAESDYICPERIQIVGRGEITYFEQLEIEQQRKLLEKIEFDKISCLLVTKNLDLPAEFYGISSRFDLPVLQTSLGSSKTIALTTAFLQEKLAPQIMIHGVLLEIHGIGVLIVGASGIGKSECALDFITRGHRLISDDSVIIKKIGSRLAGESPELTFEHLEIRGLGIVNVRDLFGISAVSRRQQIELCIELKKWSEAEEVERIGLEMREHEVLNVKLPKFVLPVSSGRNLSTLVETAVRLHLLKRDGYDAAQKLVEKHHALVSGN